jgi:hypothetical protein
MPVRRTILFIGLFIGLSIAACARAPAAPPGRLAEEVEIVFETHCGACHMSTLPSGLPGALAVFDLSRGPGWDDAMTPERWASALSRLEQPDPDLGRPTAATQHELELVRRYAARRLPP